MDFETNGDDKNILDQLKIECDNKLLQFGEYICNVPFVKNIVGKLEDKLFK